MEVSNTILKVQEIINSAVAAAEYSCCRNCIFSGQIDSTLVCRLLMDKQGGKFVDHNGRNGYLIVPSYWLCEHWEPNKKTE